MLDLLMLNRTRTVNTTVTTDQYHSTPLATDITRGGP